jgi:type III pantothenate kinase
VSTEARTRALQAWLRARWSVEARLVRAESEQLGVRNGYRRPDQLGADRWVALIGARGMTERAVCVVDAGTAVTLDALSARGEYLGGAIFPGLGLLRTSLARGTAAIGADAGDPADSLGRSTEDGVAGGTLYGLAGAIDRLIDEHRRALGHTMEVYLTGGDAPLLAPRLRAASTSVPDLVLKGLARIADSL